jgi:hypothetical protein
MSEKYEGPKLPPAYAKPTFVVPDNLVDAARAFWGDAANVVAVSDTRLPDSVPQKGVDHAD